MLHDLDLDVDQIQESQKTKCNKILSYLKQVSIFRLNIGIFHNGSMSYIPNASLVISLMLMFSVLAYTISILFTLNDTVGEAIWKTTTERLLEMKMGMIIFAHPLEFMVIWSFENSTFPEDPTELCS